MHIAIKKLKPYALLALVLLLAYLPVSTFYFGMKNDAFSDNFANKFFLSAALHSGSLPLWNPYLNYGFPVYADMGFAFYNPITWLFGFIGYNAYTLTAEVLLYIYLGGVFMYRLAFFLRLDKNISLVVAAMYMCSGFYTGCLQYINFLTAAAFLPLVLQTLLQLFNGPGYKRSFYFAAACYLVFAGGHPAIPIALVYFVAILAVLLIVLNQQYWRNVRKILLYLTVSILCLLVLYLPAVYSYASILPYYARASALPQQLYTNAGFTFSSYLSFLFPFSTITTSGIFNTDVSMRNGFFSVAGFICVLLSIKSRQQPVRVLLLTGLCMLALSAGGPAKALLYSKLPLLGYIRYNGELRVFSILCFCVVGGFGLQRIKNGDAPFGRHFTTALKTLAGVCLCIIASLLFFRHFNAGWFANLIKQPAPLAQKIKIFLQGPFQGFLLISATITLAVSLACAQAIKCNKYKWLLTIIVADVVINSIIYLPVTGVGQVTLNSIQSIYNTTPRGIPIPPLKPVYTIDTLDAKTTGLVGDLTYYNKLIGTTKLTDYPSYFTSTANYFTNKPIVTQVSRHPYLFLKNSGLGNGIVVQKFNPQRIEFTVTAPQADTLVLLQNNYKCWHAEVNGNPAPVETAFGTFMSVKVDKGTNKVVFYYRDVWLGVCLAISVLFALGGTVYIIRNVTYKLPAQNL